MEQCQPTFNISIQRGKYATHSIMLIQMGKSVNEGRVLF